MSTVGRTWIARVIPSGLPGTVLVGVGVLAAVVVSGAPSILASSANADFTLAATPTSRTAQQGQAASYTINQTKLNGFKAPVTLSASNLPAGSTATFSLQTLDTKTTSTFTVNVGASTPVGTYSSITVKGTGGGITKTITVSLKVTTPTPAPNFALTATPTSAAMLPGDTAAYTVGTSTTNGFTGSISFTVAGAPTAATSAFAPTSVPVGGSTNLQVATKNNTPAGNYTLTITGKSGTRIQTISVLLVISATGKQFPITAGSVVVPGPGFSEPLNLSMTNPNSQSLSVTNLTVSIQSVSKATGASGPCTAADFAVTQFSGSYPLTVPGGQSRSLSVLVPDSALWPQLSMLDTSSNQDGCKGASLALSFSGTGQG